MTTLPFERPPVNGGSCTSAPAKPRFRPITQAAATPRRCYLMPGRVMFGGLNLLVGDGGTLKSHLLASLAAATLGGLRLPGMTRRKDFGNVLIVSREQDQAADLRPQIAAAGGDPSRVLGLDDDHDDLGGGWNWYGFLEVLPDVIRTNNIRLVGLDPLNDLLPPGLNLGDERQVRSCLGPLHRVGMRTGACILGVGHTIKRPRGQGAWDGLGGVAFRNVARYALMVAELPDRPGVFALRTHKHQHDAGCPDLLFRHAGEGGPDRVAFLGEEQLDQDAFDAAAADPGSKMEGDQATQIIRSFWSDEPVDYRELLREADRIKVSASTLRRRMRKLGVDTRPTGQVGKQTHWCHFPRREVKK